MNLRFASISKRCCSDYRKTWTHRSDPQCSQFFRQVYFCKKMGAFWTKITCVRRAHRLCKTQVLVILSSFLWFSAHWKRCWPVCQTAQYCSWTCPKLQIDGQNHKNTGVKRAIFHKRPSKDRRVGNTGPQVYVPGSNKNTNSVLNNDKKILLWSRLVSERWMHHSTGI